MSAEKNVKDEGARLDPGREMTYGDYLHLDALLTAQHPLSPSHDEMLFIVQHQTTELWMKLMLHELHAAIKAIASDDLAPAFKMLARVSRIMEQMVSAWTVLSTMTPPEYSAIRPFLANSSGFQSPQYRCIEFALGNKNAAMLAPHARRPGTLALVEAALRAPSLYDECLKAIARHGITVPDSRLDRDWTQPYQADEGVREAWLKVYRNPTAHWDLYQLGEKLTDLEDAFRLWRFRHVTTVERVIGFKRGTGGTGGVSYLRKMLDVVLFPEIWSLRTDLVAARVVAAVRRLRHSFREADGDGIARCLRDRIPDLGLHRQHVRAVPHRHEGTAEGVTVNRGPHFHEASCAKELD